MLQPSGTVTLLFTDIEGSTRAWEEFPIEMQRALARHDALLRKSIEAAGGFVFNAFTCHAESSLGLEARREGSRRRGIHTRTRALGQSLPELIKAMPGFVIAHKVHGGTWDLVMRGAFRRLVWPKTCTAGPHDWRPQSASGVRAATQPAAGVVPGPRRMNLYSRKSSRTARPRMRPTPLDLKPPSSNWSCSLAQSFTQIEPASSPRATRRGRSMSREKTLAQSPYSESLAMAIASDSELKVCIVSTGPNTSCWTIGIEGSITPSRVGR